MGQSKDYMVRLITSSSSGGRHAYAIGNVSNISLSAQQSLQLSIVTEIASWWSVLGGQGSEASMILLASVESSRAGMRVLSGDSKVLDRILTIDLSKWLSQKYNLPFFAEHTL